MKKKKRLKKDRIGDRISVPAPRGKIDFNKINKIEKINKANRVLVILLIIVMGILLVATSFTLIRPQKFVIIQQPGEPSYYYPEFVSLGNASYVSMYLPAVDPNGKGIIATLGVEAAPGTGRVLVDIEDLVFWDDTQTSIRIAKVVANKLTGKNVSEYDLVYTIHTNASMVGGPSAGAAITMATIAALENKKLNDNVMITGSIDYEGRLGKVSSISAKAWAAKQINVTMLLVPPGQSTEIVYEIKKKCQEIENSEYCLVEQIPREMNISAEVGIVVKEIGTVNEAMKYFFD